MRLRLAFLLIVPLWVAAAIFLAATGECGGGGSCVATAKVNDIRYSIALARGMTIAESDLATYAVASRVSGGGKVVDAQTYRLGGIDPTRVLVMKLEPGQADDAGPIGDYLVLIADAGAWSLTCSYYPPGSRTRPEQCAAPTPS